MRPFKIKIFISNDIKKLESEYNLWAINIYRIISIVQCTMPNSEITLSVAYEQRD